ncbi:helix-turn-helix transcriptional regulator [Ruegeria pomeroyi]|nr:helix-turn-helix transcriptional regulator [Ruegeria pomeroyi]
MAIVFPEDFLPEKRVVAEISDGPPTISKRVEELLVKSRTEVEDAAMLVEVIVLLRPMDRKTDIDGVAKLLGLSKRSLQRELTGLGIPYRQLLSKVRMQQSIAMLEASDASVTEIALELGYNDLSHFTRAFKRSFGYPPSRH